jgi:hypothetical protein
MGAPRGSEADYTLPVSLIVPAQPARAYVRRTAVA